MEQSSFLVKTSTRNVIFKNLVACGTIPKINKNLLKGNSPWTRKQLEKLNSVYLGW